MWYDGEEDDASVKLLALAEEAVVGAELDEVAASSVVKSIDGSLDVTVNVGRYLRFQWQCYSHGYIPFCLAFILLRLHFICLFSVFSIYLLSKDICTDGRKREE